MSQHYPSRAIREMDRIVKKYGWTWAITKKGNVRWRGPSGQMVTCGMNPSYRSVKNTMANFHRAGVPKAHTGR